jgi:transposase-like protein
MKKKTSLRQRKVFSETVRKQVVKDIEIGKFTVLEASRELSVSDKSIYSWIHRYSRYLKKNKVLVVEEKSEAYKSKQLQEQIRELEATVGRKQMEIDLLNKVIELAGEEYHTDLKKNFSKRPLSGSGSTGELDTGTK